MDSMSGSETMREIRGIIQQNVILNSITTAGRGRTKSKIIGDINRVLRKHTTNRRIAAKQWVNDIEAVYEFRPLTKHNVAALRALNMKLFPFRNGKPYYKDLLKGRMGMDSLMLFEKDSDVLVGATVWWDVADETAYIATFGIRDSFRKCGLGSYLMKHCLSRIRSTDNFERALLVVIPPNEPAIKLYLKCGFVQRGTNVGLDSEHEYERILTHCNDG